MEPWKQHFPECYASSDPLHQDLMLIPGAPDSISKTYVKQPLAVELSCVYMFWWIETS